MVVNYTSCQDLDTQNHPFSSDNKIIATHQLLPVKCFSVERLWVPEGL